MKRKAQAPSWARNQAKRRTPEQIGRDADKRPNPRIPESVMKKLRRRAKLNALSVNQQIVQFVIDALKERGPR